MGTWLFYFTILAFFIPTVWAYIDGWDGMTNSYAAWIWLVVAAWLLGLSVALGLLHEWLASCCCGLVGRFVHMGIVLWVAFWGAFSLYLRYNFGCGIGESVIANIYATNEREARELIFNTNMFSMVSVPLYVLLASAVLSYILSRVLPLRLPFRLLRFLRFAALLLFVFLGCFHSYTFMFKLDEAQGPLVRYWMMSEPECLIWGHFRYKWNMQRFYELRSQKREVEVAVTDVERLPDNLVIIVGESTRREYLSLYGYPLETTPMLDSIAQTGSMVVFANAVAPRFSTRESVPESLTTHSVDSVGQDWFVMPSLPDILREAGYETFWLSAQHPFGKESWPISTVALGCDSVAFLEPLLLRKRGGLRVIYHDGDLLSYLQVGDSTRRVALFLHLEGHHTDYQKRYTDEFAIFSSEDIPYQEEEAKRHVLAHYANASRYNDWVVSEVVKRYRNTDAMVFYFSDHAQALYDDVTNPNVMGHLKSYVGLRIPFMVWMSDYALQLPDYRGDLRRQTMQIMRRAQDRLFVNDIFTQSVCGLLGIEEASISAKENLFSPEYDTLKVRRIYGGSYFGADTVDALPSFKTWLEARMQ